MLPWTIWAPAWVLVGLALVVTGFRRPAAPRDIAFRGALAALVLASMSLTLPLGPVGYHLSLLGPVGVLLGGLASFEVLFIVSAFLALVGHGGITAVGLNALVLAAGSSVARPIFRALLERMGPGGALAVAAAASQAVAGALWTIVMAVILGGHSGGTAPDHAREHAPLVWGVVVAIFVGGIVVETLVALGLGRFLARVKPELLSNRSSAAISGVEAASGGTR